MNISQWKIGDRTFFSLEVDNRLLLPYMLNVSLPATSYLRNVKIQIIKFILCFIVQFSNRNADITWEVYTSFIYNP